MATKLNLTVKAKVNLCDISLMEAVNVGTLKDGDWFEFCSNTFIVNQLDSLGLFAFSVCGEDWITIETARHISMHEIRAFTEVNITLA
jgi:hypothetical protein